MEGLAVGADIWSLAVACYGLSTTPIARATDFDLDKLVQPRISGPSLLRFTAGCQAGTDPVAEG